MCSDQVKRIAPGTQQSLGCGLITRRVAPLSNGAVPLLCPALSCDQVLTLPFARFVSAVRSAVLPYLPIRLEPFVAPSTDGCTTAAEYSEGKKLGECAEEAVPAPLHRRQVRRYFDGNAYGRWFGVLEDLLSGLGAASTSDSAGGGVGATDSASSGADSVPLVQRARHSLSSAS